MIVTLGQHFVLWKKDLFEVVETSKSCKPFLVVSLFGRGGIGLVFAPSLVEVEIVVYSLL